MTARNSYISTINTNRAQTKISSPSLFLFTRGIQPDVQNLAQQYGFIAVLWPRSHCGSLDRNFAPECGQRTAGRVFSDRSTVSVHRRPSDWVRCVRGVETVLCFSSCTVFPRRMALFRRIVVNALLIVCYRRQKQPARGQFSAIRLPPTERDLTSARRRASLRGRPGGTSSARTRAVRGRPPGPLHSVRCRSCARGRD